MSGRAGIELAPTAVRLVRLAPLTGRVSQVVEVPWDPTKPLDAVASLRSKAGPLQGIALTIGLGFLEVARLELPPVSPVERAKIVELEPDRYFAAASQDALSVAVAPHEPIAFAAPSVALRSWIAAFETWAPIEWVEPAPVSLARALGIQANATYAVEAAGAEAGLVKVVRGRLASARRTLDARVVADARPVPALGPVPAQYAAAFGVARWRSQAIATVPLAPDEWRRRVASRRRAALAMNALGAVAALVFAIWAADRWRERTLSNLEAEVALVEARGAAADTALRRLRLRESEARMIAEIVASRSDPHAALAAISAALPREATLLSARASGNDWQIDGTASDAATLVPLLDRNPQFDSVRFLSASSRYREANRAYETFSIALRVRSRP